MNEMQNCVEEAENGAEDSSDEEDGWDDDSQDSQEEEGGGAALNLDLSRLEAENVLAFLKTFRCNYFRLLASGGGAHDSTRSLFDVEEEVGIWLLYPFWHWKRLTLETCISQDPDCKNDPIFSVDIRYFLRKLAQFLV